MIPGSDPSREAQICEYTSESLKKCCHPSIGIERDSGKSYCIFHMPANQKNREAFIKQFILKFDLAEEMNMIGFRFPNISFPKGEFPRFSKAESVDLSYARFEGDVDLSGVIIPKKLFLKHSEFQCRAIFDQCDIGLGIVEPDLTEFSDRSISFEDAKFYGTTRFRSSRFMASVCFSGVDFNGPISFQRSEFHGTLLFENVDVRIGTIDFYRAKFHKQCSFSQSNISAARFIRAHFHRQVLFSNTVFAKENINKQDPTFFNNAEFYDRAGFDEAVFNANVHFSSARFHRFAEFTLAQFRSNCSFSRCWFKSADFEGSFIHYIDWKNSSCDGVLALRDLHPYRSKLRMVYLKTHSDVSINISSIFADDRTSISLLDCTIAGRFLCVPVNSFVQLTRCSFQMDLRIDPNIDPDYTKDDSPLWELAISACHFCAASTGVEGRMISMAHSHIDTEFILLNMDMGIADFTGTNVANLRFDNVTWPKLDRSIFGFGYMAKAYALNDEYRIQNRTDRWGLRQAPSISKALSENILTAEAVANLINQYRSISNSYEIHGNFEMAGAFKASEYDLRRRSKSNSSFLERILLSMYKLVSAYGESIVLPISWIVILLIGFSALNLLIGIPVTENSREGYHLLKYGIFTGGFNVFQYSSHLWSSICFSISNMIPGVSNSYSGYLSQGIKVTMVLYRVMTLLTLTTLVFAVRRKLKR